MRLISHTYEHFANIFAKNQNFKKLGHGFVDKRTLITMTLISSCHWKTLVRFCLRKKRPEICIFNINSELWQNRKEKKLCHLKQH